MTPEEAVAALDALDTSDPESAHFKAEEIALAVAGPDVRAAFDRVAARCRWWAYA